MAVGLPGLLQGWLARLASHASRVLQVTSVIQLALSCRDCSRVPINLPSMCSPTCAPLARRLTDVRANAKFSSPYATAEDIASVR